MGEKPSAGTEAFPGLPAPREAPVLPALLGLSGYHHLLLFLKKKKNQKGCVLGSL